MHPQLTLLEKIKDHIDGGKSRAQIASVLKTLGMKDTDAHTLLNIAYLYQDEYFSRTNKLNRLLIRIFMRDEQTKLNSAYDYLVTCRLYTSRGHAENILNQNAQSQILSQDTLYPQLNPTQQKIYLIVNMHLEDLKPDPALIKTLLNSLSKRKNKNPAI